jgi:hypothetical protein
MSTPQQWLSSQVQPDVPVNENWAALGQAFIWAHDKPADSGLDVGLAGGRFNETDISSQTLTCVDDDTNYIVVHRVTLAASVSVLTTNWDASGTYGRVASVVFASGVLTAWNDERYSQGGIFDSAAAVLGAIAAEDVSVADTGGYFTGTDVEAVLQEVGAALGGFGTGDVTGPGSAVDGHLVQFDGTTGKLLKDGIALDTDTTLAANSDTRVATQKAVKTYVDNAVTGLWDVKGSTDCSANPNYPAASKGDAYVVSVAGKIGGASGTSVDVGDVFVALADNAGGTEASVGSSWFHIEHNLSGVALTSGNLSQFASTTSAQLAGVISDETGSGALVFANSPTLVTPALGTPASGNLGNCTGLPVAGGGTGAATLTNHGVLLGQGTSAVAATAAGTAGQRLRSNGASADPTWEGPYVEAVTYGATTTVTLTGKPDGAVFRVTLTGNTTIELSGGTDGQKFILELIQDGTGSRLVTLSSTYFRFGSDITSFTATTTASKLDRVGCIYNTAATKADVIATAKGY